MPRPLLDAIKDWVLWVCQVTGCPPVAPIPFHQYPPENGIRLGSEPWRMGFAAWRNATGLFGHQHVPENVHGDPGALDIGKVLAYAKGGATPTPTPKPAPKPKRGVLVASARALLARATKNASATNKPHVDAAIAELDQIK